MTMNRKPAGGSAWRTLPPRIRSKTPGLALLGLALIGLLQAGCRSDGCSNCNLGSKLSNGVQALGARFSKHFDGCNGGDSCGCGSEGMVMDSGTPVISGGVVIPAPGTILPPPSIESAPTQLEAIPPGSTSGASSNSSRNAPNGNNRSGYTTMVPRNGLNQARRSDVSRALLSTSDSPSRSTDANASSDLFDKIPPVPSD